MVFLPGLSVYFTTMVPAITGLRLREAFEQSLPQMSIRAFYQQKVLEARVMPDNTFQFLAGAEARLMKVKARGAILASGRFFGKGLRADRLRIHETIFDLPVSQPKERTLWHHKNLLHPQATRSTGQGWISTTVFDR